MSPDEELVNDDEDDLNELKVLQNTSLQQQINELSSKIERQAQKEQQFYELLLKMNKVIEVQSKEKAEMQETISEMNSQL